MKPDFDYQSVPFHYVHCFNKQCERAVNCLHYQVTLHLPSCECCTLTALNPAYTVPVGEDCRYFSSDQLQQFALGMTHLLDDVPLQVATVLKRQLMAYFGRATYYRCWRKERLIKPAEQECIRRLFRKNGITAEPVFDECIEQYAW